MPVFKIKEEKPTIRRMREIYGLDREGLAKIVGVSAPTISNYERGKTIPDVVTAKKIAEFFNVPLKDINFLK